MILTRSETSVQLTYTLGEYREFNHAIVAFRNEITGTLRNEVSLFMARPKNILQSWNRN